jgi:3-phenylpropionate/trans-cinnamate dioxygenase ferredoxin subunit
MTDNRKIDAGFGPEDKAIDFAFKIVERSHPPKARSGRRVTVCAATELPPGARRIVDIDGISIGVFNVGGRLCAIKNVCPHMGAPICQGTIHATHRPSEVHEFDPALENQILRCPWHGWEFDLITGKGLYDATSRVATYAAQVDEAGDVIIIL